MTLPSAIVLHNPRDYGLPSSLSNIILGYAADTLCFNSERADFPTLASSTYNKFSREVGGGGEIGY